MWSVQDFRFLNPACSSEMLQCFGQPFLNSFAKDFIVSDRRVIPFQLLELDMSPFVANFTIGPFFQSFCRFFASQMSLKICARSLGVTVSSTFSISAVTPSEPGAFKFFITFITIFTSSSVGGSVSSSASGI